MKHNEGGNISGIKSEFNVVLIKVMNVKGNHSNV